MSLTQDLTNLQANNRAQLPADVATTMAQATEDLANSGIVDRSLKLGDMLPAIALLNATGQTVDIQALLANGPVVMTFYRGGWCPYCNLELRAYQQVLPEIKALGATLVAITPETPDNSLSTTEKNELEFEVLSDVGNQVARQIGLVFTLPKSLRPIYTSFGIDVPAHNGDQNFELPLAATYVINPDGTVIHAFVDADYTKREEPEIIVNVLKKLPVKA
ncbi:MAG: AhpC/TSA family protein [Cyanothece sp. SIO2G6]|nr:AhpC/TSA family protein [Cyanothece sp. SIO2G6]